MSRSQRPAARLAVAGLLAAAAGAVGSDSGAGVGAGVPGESLKEFDYTTQPFQVLLTGFLGFLNFSSNPTTDIANILGGTCDSVDIFPDPAQTAGSQVVARLKVCWTSKVLPVNETGALWPTEHLRERAKQGPLPYDAVLHCGLEDFAKGLKIEVAAVNIKANDTGDDGRIPAVSGAPRLLATTVNTGWLSLKAENLPIVGMAATKPVELWSRNAGKYYCNEVYFRTLEYIRTEGVTASTGALLPAAFVHVQNSTACRPEDDAKNIRQIAAHMLWATYIAPGFVGRPPPAVLMDAPGPFAAATAATVAQERPAPSVLASALAGALIGGLCTAAALLGPVRRRPAALGSAATSVSARSGGGRGLSAPLHPTHAA